MNEKIKYRVNDYLKRYNGKKLSVYDLRDLWSSYYRDIPQVDLQPLADRPSEREYSDSFRKYLDTLINAGLIEEVSQNSRTGRKR